METFPKYIFLMQANNGHDWVDYFSALLVPAVAIFAAWIAKKQMDVSRNKLKSELFDRRVKIYEAMKNAIYKVAICNKFDQHDIQEFLNGTLGIIWLFDNDLLEYKNEIHDNIIKWNTEGNDDKKFALKLWFRNELVELDNKFKKYLLLAH